MSYTSVFGGTTIYPSDVSYLPLVLAADTTLEWPLEASGDVAIAARIIGVTPSGAGRSVIMPDATRTGPGQSVLFNNMSGSYSFFVKDDAGNTLATVASGTQWQIYLTDNTTAAGTWEVYQMGASTATVQASALAGPGLTVYGSQLAQAAPFTQFTGDLSPSISNRAAMYVYTGSGAATVSLPSATTVGSTFFLRLRNQGGGVLLLDPAGSDLINGAVGLNLAPEDSAMLICDGVAAWYTVGLGQNAEFTFDFVSIPVSGGTLTLSASQLNRIAYRFTGNLAANVEVVVPDTVQQYWVDNQTTGGFTLGLKTASQTLPTLVNQNASAILYCDGQAVVPADTGSIALPLAVSQGGTGATSATGARGNLGISTYADPLVTAADASAAQAVLFPAPITNGQLLVGNAASPGFAQTTLTAGTGIDILNTPGGITVVANGSPAPGSVYSQRFSGTGAQTAFTLAYQPYTEENTQVYVSGVYQQKNTYSLSGFTLTFNAAPPLGTDNIEVVVIQVVPIGVTYANLVSYSAGAAGSITQTVESKLRQTISVLDFGAVGDGATNDTAAVTAAVAAALASGAYLFWPQGTYLTTASIPNLHSVNNYGPGIIQRGTDLFYISPSSTQRNILYVATTGNDANDGLSSAVPFLTGQAAANAVRHWEPQRQGIWRLKFAAGTYVGSLIINFPSLNMIELYGVSGWSTSPTVIFDGNNNPALSADSGAQIYVQDLWCKNSTDNVVQVQNGSYMEWMDAHATDATGSSSGACVYVANQSQALLDGKSLFANSASSDGVVTAYGLSIISMGRTASSIANAPRIRNGARGAKAQEQSLIKLRYAFIEDCTWGVYTTYSSRISHENGSIYRSNTVPTSYGYFSIDNSNILLSDLDYATAWSNVTAYVIGDRVFSTVTQRIYTALTNNTNKEPSANPSDWAVDTSISVALSGVTALRYTCDSPGVADRPLGTDDASWRRVGLFAASELTNSSVTGATTATILAQAMQLLPRDFNVKGRAIKIIVYGNITGSAGTKTLTISGSVGGAIRSIVLLTTDFGDFRAEFVTTALSTGPGTVDVLNSALVAMDAKSPQFVVVATTDSLSEAQDISVSATLSAADTLQVFAVEVYQSGV